MGILAFIIFSSSMLVMFAYLSRALTNDIERKDHVFDHTGRHIKTDGVENLFWFVQVTDIHISRYRGYERAPDLKRFCDIHLSVIKPDLVIASGDLTDAKHRNLKGSKQFKDEWQTYHTTVLHCQNIVNTWLDLRGNHDAFDIPDHDHPDNFFRIYSSQGEKHPSSYVYHHQKPYGSYSFLAVDAAPNPGPKRPFNFFGYMRQEGEQLANQLLNESRTSNMTIAFGHYPTSLIATQSGNSIRYILRNVTAYLCGHLHTLGGIVPRMYARHKSGMLELELGDWKDERIYRVLAVDHDMLSIQDEVLDNWPVLVITNPKEASIQAPLHEPLYAMNKSTHIRMLVFTPGEINNIEVHIDGGYVGKAKNIEGPVFTLPWNPALYQTGVHTIQVSIQDSVHGHHIREQQFSLDFESPLLPLKGRFLLMMNISSVVQTIFYLVVTVYVGVLIALNKCSNINSHMFTQRRGIIGFVVSIYNNWLYRLWLLTRESKLYYPLILHTLYVAFGPWFMGEILEGHTGIVFVWGMFVHGSYLPVCLTYVYGVFQLVTFNIPEGLFLGYILHFWQKHRSTSVTKSLCHTSRHIYFPFLTMLAFQCYITMSEFPSAYGTKALLLGPVRTGSILLAVYLFFMARTINPNTLANRHTQ